MQIFTSRVFNAYKIPYRMLACTARLRSGGEGRNTAAVMSHCIQPTSAVGAGLPACDLTRRALRLSECPPRFISQPARLQQKMRGKVKPTAVQRASASSSPLNSALEKADLFGCIHDIGMRRRQRCLPKTQSLARALHGPRHIPSLLVAEADVVQG
jgi:hypothetical protein